jgi:hypothetical protein
MARGDAARVSPAERERLVALLAKLRALTVGVPAALESKLAAVAALATGEQAQAPVRAPPAWRWSQPLLARGTGRGRARTAARAAPPRRSAPVGRPAHSEGSATRVFGAQGCWRARAPAR